MSLGDELGSGKMTRSETDADRPEGESERRPAGDEEIGRGLFEEDMGPGSAMAHLYRGEIHRMERWRDRLDRTTYWAVTVIAAILTWAFSSQGNPHYLILIAIAVLTVFLNIEARRFRGYDIWRSRVRLLQKNVFAYALDPSGEVSDSNWREELSRDYLRPTMKVTLEESIAHRLRRVYFPMYGLLLVAWFIRITGFATRPWPESAGIAWIPGLVVTGAVAVFYLSLVVVAYRPRKWHVEREIEGYEIDPWD